MLSLIAISIAFAIGLVVVLIAELIPARTRAAVERRLAEIDMVATDPHSLLQRRRRQKQRERLVEILEEVGTHVSGESRGAYQQLLHYAGFRRPAAPAIFWGTRLLLAGGSAALVVAGTPLVGLPAWAVLLAAGYVGAIGWVLPVLWLRMRKNARQKEIQKALADALDLLVVCVEAGLGLNQALMRVAEEIRHVSMILSMELALVNAEIRAGAARDQALRSLAERTGVEDIRSLVTMLIQTDRFGTSIARSLRIHSETLRTKRRQRAEEAAAKTAIKMVFPLVFCIFPAMFVVLIGPGLIMIFRALSGVGL